MVKYLQKIYENSYRQLIEAGTSSDRMMALSEILVSNQLAQANLVKLYRDLSSLRKSSKLEPLRQKIPWTYQSLKKIHQNAMIIWFQHCLTSEKAKILNHKFVGEATNTTSIEVQIENSLYPLFPIITRNKLRVYLANLEAHRHFEVKGDWTRYKLIMFSLLHSAINASLFNGEIVIILKSMPLKPMAGKFSLQTEIVLAGGEVDNKSLFSEPNKGINQIVNKSSKEVGFSY